MMKGRKEERRKGKGGEGEDICPRTCPTLSPPDLRQADHELSDPLSNCELNRFWTTTSLEFTSKERRRPTLAAKLPPNYQQEFLGPAGPSSHSSARVLPTYAARASILLQHLNGRHDPPIAYTPCLQILPLLAAIRRMRRPLSAESPDLVVHIDWHKPLLSDRLCPQRLALIFASTLEFRDVVDGEVWATITSIASRHPAIQLRKYTSAGLLVPLSVSASYHGIRRVAFPAFKIQFRLV